MNGGTRPADRVADVRAERRRHVLLGEPRVSLAGTALVVSGRRGRRCSNRRRSGAASGGSSSPTSRSATAGQGVGHAARRRRSSWPRRSSALVNDAGETWFRPTGRVDGAGRSVDAHERPARQSRRRLLPHALDRRQDRVHGQRRRSSSGRTAARSTPSRSRSARLRLRRGLEAATRATLQATRSSSTGAAPRPLLAGRRRGLGLTWRSCSWLVASSDGATVLRVGGSPSTRASVKV